MELISQNKKIGIVIVALLLVMVWVIVFAIVNRTYSASDVLGDHADLNTENPLVDIESINRGTEDIFTSIEIPKETQQEFIEAFKNAKFKRVTDGSMDTDYRVNITLNTGYAMWVDSDKKLLKLIDTYEYYTIENDSDFFEILENATE
ncbi:hypothetical protein SAMN04487786_0647 [Paenisporosarcina quisquiliarum]|nr:hypothetical protein SAMN04487786_0647 [Paenisporosarcina quisquiliarum]